MKKLLLVRHAKAEKDISVKDIDRPLKYIGMQDASFMAARLKEQSLIPQLIVSSPSLRTKTTAEIFADQFSLPQSHLNKAIYEASEPSLLKVINHLPNEYDFICLVGHNPSISQALYYLTGEFRDVHTGTAALINFEVDSWDAIGNGSGSLAYYSWPGAKA